MKRAQLFMIIAWTFCLFLLLLSWTDKQKDLIIVADLKTQRSVEINVRFTCSLKVSLGIQGKLYLNLTEYGNETIFKVHIL